MTESERIIKMGLLPASFLKEETRCGFPVSEQRKRIWAIVLDLYRVFKGICEKYGLRYFALYGTLLGVVRHKGMIPWDDDLDVGMPREDYDFFCKVCPPEFQYPYLLQTPYTDPGFFYSFAKIRNYNTTCISNAMKKAKYCQGIFMDVFPLDWCNPVTFEMDREKIYSGIMKCSSAMKKGNSELDAAQLIKIEKYHTDNPLVEFEEVQSIASNPEYAHSGYIGVPVNTILKSNQQIWRAEDFSDYVLMPYENMEMRVPVGFDRVLRTTYGDYMEFPPIEDRGKWHDDLFWNPDKTYQEYI